MPRPKFKIKVVDLFEATFEEWLDDLSLINHNESPHLKKILNDLYNEGLTPLDARDALEVYYPEWHDELTYLEEHPIG